MSMMLKYLSSLCYLTRKEANYVYREAYDKTEN